MERVYPAALKPQLTSFLARRASSALRVAAVGDPTMTLVVLLVLRIVRFLKKVDDRLSRIRLA